MKDGKKGITGAGGLAVYFCMSILLACLLPASHAHAARHPGSRNILVLYHEAGWAAPSNRMMFTGMKEFFEEHGGDDITIYSETLDLSLFKGADEQALVDFYRFKYAQHEPIDVLVPIQGPSLQFLLKYRDSLFPGVPIVYIAPVEITPPPARRDYLTGITLAVDIKGTVDLMLKIHPGLKNIALVAGTGTIDRDLAGLARTALQADFRGMRTIDLTSLTMDQTLARVSRLPRSTAVLFLPFFMDGAGQRFIPAEALQMVSRRANAPVYCVYDSHLGHGCVGGSMTSYEALGKRAAGMVLRVLNGERPGAISPELMGSAGAMFDWRAMRRWGIPESALPEGSIIRYRELSAWEQGKWYIIGSVLFAVVEAMLIAYLLLTIRTRKRVEQELRESEVRYRTIADFTYDWEYWIDPKGVFLYNSPSCERVTGYSPDEFAHDPGLRRKIVIPEDQGVWENHLHEEARMLEPRSTRFRVRRKDGQILWIDHTCVPVKDASGRFLGFRASNRDITERTLAEEHLVMSRRNLVEEIIRRKSAQEALAASEADLKRAQEVARIGNWQFDIGDNSLIWSDGVYRIFGQTREIDLDPRAVLEMVHPDDRAQVQSLWQAALQGQPYDVEHRIMAEGTVKWVREKAEVDFNRDDSPVRITGIVQDITRRKLMENEQHKLLQSLAHVSRISTVGELTSTLAHEINQPLAAILANAQAARHMIDEDEPDLEELGETLEDIINDDKRAREVVQRIRGLMKKDSASFEKTEVKDIIQEALKLVEKEAHIRSIGIRVECDPAVPQVAADRIQIQQVLINLLINAMESMTDDGSSRSITVRSFVNDTGNAVVSVEDTGKGISQEEGLQVFEPFYTTKKGGLGLGLSISRSIIEAHGGKLLSFPNPVGGMVFFFSLPAVKGMP